MQYFCCPVINISDIFSESFRTFHQLAKRQLLTIFQLGYKYEDSLSLKTDKKSNKFLSKALNIIEIMGEDDVVQLAVNLIPYKRRPVEWKTFCDDTYDRFKKKKY